MKIVLGALIAILLFSGIAKAESYLIVNKTTDEVISLSPIDDAQVTDSNWQKIVLENNISDYDLQFHPTDYKYKDKKFIVNVKKQSDKELLIQTMNDKFNKKKQDRKNALDKIKLIAGLTEEEVEALLE